VRLSRPARSSASSTAPRRSFLTAKHSRSFAREHLAAGQVVQHSLLETAWLSVFHQLTGVTHSNGSFSNESFTWDSNGNETGAGYTTGADNEQTASPGYTYTYDHAGEMTSETQTSTGDVWTYGYDFIGRMVTAVEKTSGGTTLESVTFTYDALGNRIGTNENSTKTWTLYDQGNPIMDFNSSGSLTVRYLWGPMGIVARQTSGGTVSWYLADKNGTVRDLINDYGAIIDHVDFSAFGTVLDESSPTNGDRMMGFAGLERDTVTGLNLAVFREENPGTGRWNSQDPLGFAAEDANLYRYVGNDAVGYADSLGLQRPSRRPPSPKPSRPVLIDDRTVAGGMN
jgi:RHS repeat-associated protein